MPLKLISPLYETFELKKTDEKYGSEGEASFVVIKQAAQHEHERRQQLFATLERKFSEIDPNQFSLVQTLSSEELKRTEVWLTMVECNIQDQEGKNLFPSKKDKAGHSTLNMTQEAFNRNWGLLPPDVCLEIHGFVQEVNKVWAGPLEKDEQKKD